MWTEVQVSGIAHTGWTLFWLVFLGAYGFSWDGSLRLWQWPSTVGIHDYFLVRSARPRFDPKTRKHPQGPFCDWGLTKTWLLTLCIEARRNFCPKLVGDFQEPVSQPSSIGWIFNPTQCNDVRCVLMRPPQGCFIYLGWYGTACLPLFVKPMQVITWQTTGWQETVRMSAWIPLYWQENDPMQTRYLNQE